VAASTPWAILLCKFSDNAAEPMPRTFYERLFTTAGAGTMNMVKFFHDNSHAAIDLTGSRVFGWYTLKQKRSDYVGSGPNQQGRQDLVTWARQAAAAAQVDLSKYYGVVVVMNVQTDLFGSAARHAVCDPLSMQPSILGQEMGHGYGLDHSRVEGSQDDYKDPWDVMSTWNSCHTQADPNYQAIGPGLNAANMRGRGWLDETRVWRGPETSYTTTVVLRPLHRHDLSGWLAAELPGGWLFEYRHKSAWDGAIPRSAVLVHSFDDNQSYLHRGSAGNYDLVAGDKFEKTTYSATARRDVSVTVKEINQKASTATLEISYGFQLLSIPEMFVRVTHGVMVDGGGWVFINGKLKRVPPRGPVLRILQQLMLFSSDELAHAAPDLRDLVRRGAVDAMASELDQLRHAAGPFHTPAPLIRGQRGEHAQTAAPGPAGRRGRRNARPQ
jgi:hypothetical protein